MLVIGDDAGEIKGFGRGLERLGGVASGGQDAGDLDARLGTGPVVGVAVGGLCGFAASRAYAVSPAAASAKAISRSAQARDKSLVMRDRIHQIVETAGHHKPADASRSLARQVSGDGFRARLEPGSW